MIHWAFTTVTSAKGGDPRPVAALECDDDEQFFALVARFRRAGLRYLSGSDWEGMRWPDTTCTMTLQPAGGVLSLIELHTGKSRILPDAPQPLPPLFAASVRTRVLVALVPRGTLPSIGTDVLAPPETLEHYGALMRKAADERVLLAGYARVLDQPAPAPGGRPRRG